MNKLVQAALLLSASTLSWQASATEKHWSVGIGSYAFILENHNAGYNDDLEFTGINFSLGYAVNNHFQIRASYFVLDDDKYRYVPLESKGYDVIAYGGTGFAKKGFRGYGGGGFYNDSWNNGRSFSGMQLSGGLGYNWGAVVLDFVTTLRDEQEYEGILSREASFIALSGNLTLSYLF